MVAHNITGWGGVNIQHGPVVDFNADYGRGGKYGFHYWEWSQPLLWAYMGTRDPKYLDAFDELFNQWYEQRDDVVGAYEDKGSDLVRTWPGRPPGTAYFWNSTVLTAAGSRQRPTNGS